ncbi:DMT family transporter [Oxalobacteraceae bacterium OM1]|nr:DMT family transporter [Oxalobacteraceae bacterium OM1]
MVGAVGLLSLMDTAMKLLVAHYPPLQVAALRGITSLPLITLYVLWRGRAGTLLKVRWPLHLLRAVIGIAMLALFTFGLRVLPLTEAYTLSFIAPMLITVLSVIFLKEKVEGPRWVAIVVGLLGVLVVLRPTGAGLGGLAVLAAAVLYAITAITVRVMARSDSAESLVFWLTFMVAVGAGILASPDWMEVRRSDWPTLAALAVTGFLGQLCITEAFRHGEASAIAPYEYTALAWGVGIDYLLWQTLPDQWTLLGAAIIVSAGIYLVRREGKAMIDPMETP